MMLLFQHVNKIFRYFYVNYKYYNPKQGDFLKTTFLDSSAMNNGVIFSKRA